jgi:hypothetical protein
VGTTDAEIQANFPTVFLCNFTHNPTVDTQFGTAGPYQIAWLSTMYTAYGGNLPNLYTAFARQLGVANLLLARSSFGPGLDYYVGEFAPAAVEENYFAAVARGQSTLRRMSHWDYVNRGLGNFIPPQFTMTQEQIWWEAFAVKGATVESAFVSTALIDYAAGKSAFEFGYWVGGYLYLALDKIDPNINIEIGDIIGVTVDDIVDTVSDGGTTVYGTGYVDWGNVVTYWDDDATTWDFYMESFDWIDCGC